MPMCPFARKSPNRLCSKTLIFSVFSFSPCLYMFVDLRRTKKRAAKHGSLKSCMDSLSRGLLLFFLQLIFKNTFYHVNELFHHIFVHGHKFFFVAVFHDP